MKSIFFKRMGAYLIDFIIVTLIVTVITMGFKENDKLKNRLVELNNNYINEEISMEEYSEEIFELNYDYQKSILPSSIVSVVVSIGYFIVFATLNRGQTLGKKLFKIRIVNMDNKDPNIWNMMFRSIPLYGILTGIINIIGLYILNVKMFNYTSTIVNYAYYGFVIICLFMVMYKKDGRGLHDLIGRTYVKEK